MVFSHHGAALAALCLLVLRASGMHVSSALGAESQSANRSAFISDDGSICKEGPSRSVESALALAKAGVKGELYRQAFAQANQTCYDLGFAWPGAEDACHPGVAAFHMNGDGPPLHRRAEESALRRYANLWNLTEDVVSLMAACTCHPHSVDMAVNRHNCSQLDAYQGSWVHRNPVTREELLCDGGPFIYSTLALAVIKSYAQLAMHESDTIAPKGCDSLGFPNKYHAADHCFPALYMWTKTADAVKDYGLIASSYIEDQLFAGGFAMWAKAKNKDLDMSILGSKPGCHCMPGSSVYQPMAEKCKARKAAGDFSPVRDWWGGQVP